MIMTDEEFSRLEQNMRRQRRMLDERLEAMDRRFALLEQLLIDMQRSIEQLRREMQNVTAITD